MAGTVTVACKLPHGLNLDLMEPAAADGTRSAIPKARVTIQGSALPVGVPLPEDAPRIQGGYALTQNVDEDFWTAWLAQNSNYAPVKQGLIFALPKSGNTEAKAREQGEIRSGLEPLNPAKPSVRGIEPAAKAA